MNAPLDDLLYHSVDPLRLAGSSCTSCGTTTFPVQADCPRCTQRTMVEVELPHRGVLWTWTLQTFPPKPPYVAPPDGFRPFPVGYVDLGNVLVESRIDADPESLRVGMILHLAPFDVHAEDQTHLGFAFVPAHLTVPA